MQNTDPVIVVALLLAAALLGGMLAHRARQPVLLGYMFVGILAGPYALGLITDVGLIKSAAAIGVTLLMFTLGLEVSFTQLRQVGNVGLIGGIFQILMTFAFGLAVGWLIFEWTVPEAVIFGLAISLSSTMIGLRILMDKGELGSVHGRIMIAILILQDISVTVMLIVVSLIGQPVDNVFNAVALAVGKAAIFVFAAIITGVWILPWIFGKLGGIRSRELFVLSLLVLCLMAGFGTHILGLSVVFGAFIIGLVLRESVFAQQALAEITPLRDIFATLFFLSLGMLLNPQFVFENWSTILLIVLCIIVIKVAVVYFLVISFGYSNKTALLSGAGLFQIGEFSFILAQAGTDNNIASQEFYSLVVASAIITMLLSPLLFGLASWLVLKIDKISAGKPGTGAMLKKRILPQIEEIQAQPCPVILAGYGRIGSKIATSLSENRIPFIVVEFDPEIITELKRENIPYIYGDISNYHILAQLFLDKAQVLVITAPDFTTTKSAVINALRINPHLEILARVSSEKESQELKKLGDIQFINPEYEASIEFSRRIMEMPWCKAI